MPVVMSRCLHLVVPFLPFLCTLPSEFPSVSHPCSMCRLWQGFPTGAPLSSSKVKHWSTPILKHLSFPLALGKPAQSSKSNLGLPLPTIHSQSLPNPPVRLGKRFSSGRILMQSPFLSQRPCVRTGYNMKKAVSPSLLK